MKVWALTKLRPARTTAVAEITEERIVQLFVGDVLEGVVYVVERSCGDGLRVLRKSWSVGVFDLLLLIDT